MGRDKEARKALLTVNHPLNHSQSFREAKPQSTEEKLTYIYDRAQIGDLLNTYGYNLDTVMVDSKNVRAWVDLFTEDCELTYPFGTHHGKQGLGEWCLQAETRFKRMIVSVCAISTAAKTDRRPAYVFQLYN